MSTYPTPEIPDTYHAAYQAFRWPTTTWFNLAEVCCRRWAVAQGERTALIIEDQIGHVSYTSYNELMQKVDQLSHGLTSLGLQRGDSVGVILPQCVQTVVVHLACYQMGLMVVPLSMLFGDEAVLYRLKDAKVKVLVLEASHYPMVAALRSQCPDLHDLIRVRGDGGGGGGGVDAIWDWETFLPPYAPFEPVMTKGEDPAVLIYTSGTTGSPKGAVIPHRAILGNLTGFVASQNQFPQPHDVFWSPADWAWTGGLWDVLLPTLYFGQTLVGYGGRFKPHHALDLMARHRVTNTFLFPTALKMIMKSIPFPKNSYDLHLRAIMSAGEPLGTAVLQWCVEAFGVMPNEMFGQTEINYIIGNAHYQTNQNQTNQNQTSLFEQSNPTCWIPKQATWSVRPGSMGRAYLGHRIALLDEQGGVCPIGEIGEIAVHRKDVHGDLDPVFFLGYWHQDEATAKKYDGDWCRTGDLAQMDEDGYFWYKGRCDDVFKSSGYRISPNDIENCLLKHDKVLNCAIIPVPDKDRGTVIRAVIVLIPELHQSVEHDDDAKQHLQQHLQQYVRQHLAAYQVPKQMVFVEALPMTTTGKIQRKVLRDAVAML